MMLKNLDSGLIVASTDNLIYSDIKNEKDQILKIPQPILPENPTKGQLDLLQKENRTITCVEISKCSNYIVATTENKQVVVFNRNFEVVKNFTVNRSASKALFTSNNDILIADKTGDVYLYKLKDNNPPILLLGHLSVILDVVLSECEKYIITCDRDEKIRVSRFPNAYNIVSFCLGHKEFVTKLKIVDNVLFSASGDGTLRLWNYKNGEQLQVINTNEHLKMGILEEFSTEMDAEKVDVEALPVTDMQVSIYPETLITAVSIHNYAGIQVYQIDRKTFKTNLLKNIESDVKSLSFCLCENLFVLSNKLQVFKSTNNFNNLESQYLNQLYNKYKEVFKHADSSITTLYKRKFDNVQEYLERKKQRLEGK